MPMGNEELNRLTSAAGSTEDEAMDVLRLARPVARIMQLGGASVGSGDLMQALLRTRVRLAGPAEYRDRSGDEIVAPLIEERDCPTCGHRQAQIAGDGQGVGSYHEDPTFPGYLRRQIKAGEGD